MCASSRPNATRRKSRLIFHPRVSRLRERRLSTATATSSRTADACSVANTASSAPRPNAHDLLDPSRRPLLLRFGRQRILKKTVLTQAHVDALTTLRAANRRKPFQPRHRQLCRSRRHARDRRHRRRHRHLSHARRHLHPQRHPRRRNASGRDLHRSPGRTTKELHR